MSSKLSLAFTMSICIRSSTLTTRSHFRTLFKHNHVVHSHLRRTLATQPQANPSSSNSRRSSMITQETAREWKDLSFGQKTIAATKTTANLGIIALGLGVTGVLVYYIVTELFGSQSSTKIFGDALERIRKNEEVISLIGSPIKGHGEPSQSRMRRNRKIASQVAVDKDGNEHLLMRFFVEGPIGEGVSHLDMLKNPKGKWEYKYIIIDVPGQGLPSKRIFIEYNENAGKIEAT